MKYRKLLEGIDGKGTKIYLVQTIENGSCIWIETFNSLNEAKNWIKYA